MRIHKLLLSLTLALSTSAYANNVFIVTSFGSFPGVSYNPTQTVANNLPDYLCKHSATNCNEEDKVYIVKQHLPVTWGVIDAIPEILEYHNNTSNVIGILSLGYDPRFAFPRGLTLEKYAVNEATGLDSDGKGRKAYEESLISLQPYVIHGAPTVLSMPNDIQLDLVKQQIEEALPPFAEADNFLDMYDVERVRVGKLDRGNTYICNATHFTNMYNTDNTTMFGGFVHIKYPDEFISEQMMADAVEIYIQHVIDVRLK